MYLSLYYFYALELLNPISLPVSHVPTHYLGARILSLLLSMRVEFKHRMGGGYTCDGAV